MFSPAGQPARGHQPANRRRQHADQQDADGGRKRRLPAHAVVGARALGLGQHEHEQKRDQDRAGVDHDRGHGQELGAGEQEQAGDAQQRQAKPDGAVDRIAEVTAATAATTVTTASTRNMLSASQEPSPGNRENPSPSATAPSTTPAPRPAALPRGSISHGCHAQEMARIRKFGPWCQCWLQLSGLVSCGWSWPVVAGAGMRLVTR